MSSENSGGMIDRTESLYPVALLAGGLATRLRPITEKIPKSLVEVAGRPFIHWQLELLRRRGIERVVVCAGHLGGMIREEVGVGDAFGLTVEYSFDGPTPLGTAGALRQALDILGPVFFVLYGDSYLDCDYLAVQKAYLSSGKPALMAVYENGGRYDVSNVVLHDGRIVVYDKKNRTPNMKWIDYGLGILSAAVLKRIPKGEFADLSDLYAAILAENGLAGFEVEERFYEIGSFTGLSELANHLCRP